MGFRRRLSKYSQLEIPYIKPHSLITQEIMNITLNKSLKLVFLKDIGSTQSLIIIMQTQYQIKPMGFSLNQKIVTLKKIRPLIFLQDIDMLIQTLEVLELKPGVWIMVKEVSILFTLFTQICKRQGQHLFLILLQMTDFTIKTYLVFC